MWHEMSVVTVDRRNGRDHVAMREKLFKERFSHLTTPDDHEAPEAFIDKRGRVMMKATRRIATVTIREMRNAVIERIGKIMSIGTVLNLRPFYVQPPSEREKESCLCKFCLNLRLKFNAVMKHCKENRPDSISEYFGSNISCALDASGFYQLKCINKTCCNPACIIKPEHELAEFNVPAHKVKFHQFEIESYEYHCKKEGKMKEGKRTIRKDHHEDLSEIKEALDAKGHLYLEHRWEIKNDHLMWPKILEQSSLGYVYHMDYSENVTCTPKHEPQDAHFSGKQTVLHCTVLRTPHRDVRYVYHLSDDKIKDAAFTECVLKDLLKISTDQISTVCTDCTDGTDCTDCPIIRIKSDNCSTQYCSKSVFARYSSLAVELQKTIILYYGVNGHGRGLVDAMSGFGLKTPLRKKIVTHDFYFNTAEELAEFCRAEFASHLDKHYAIITEEALAEARVFEESRPIAGCRRSRMIALHADGRIEIKRDMCACDNCLVGNFSQCIDDREHEKADEEEDNLLTNLDEEVEDEFLYIEEQTFAAIQSSTHFELFYIVKINKRCVAEHSKTDLGGHIIQEGELYFEGKYLEKTKETKTKVFYKEVNNVVFFHAREIFFPDVAIDETTLTLTKSEYQFIADAIPFH
jgi:hypothetical protein